MLLSEEAMKQAYMKGEGISMHPDDLKIIRGLSVVSREQLKKAVEWIINYTVIKDDQEANDAWQSLLDEVEE